MRRHAIGFAVLATLVISIIPPELPAQGVPARSEALDAANMRVAVSRFGQVPTHTHFRTDIGAFWPLPVPGYPTNSSHKENDLVYEGSPLITGYVRGELRVSGSVFRENYVPGPILPGLKTVAADNPLYRIYTIHAGQEDEEDYREWPAQLGAPTDSSGAPLFYGSPQMFWVMNDLDSASMQEHMGSAPMGVEVQCVLHPLFSQGNLTSDALILRLTYINKSSDTIRDAYIGYRTDPDLRDPSNDAAATDSSLALAYVYDNLRWPAEEPTPPAAYGVCMLQTPVVPSEEGDRARWMDGWRQGYRNAPVSGAVAPVKTSMGSVGEPDGEDAPVRWYAMMQGRGYRTTVRNPLTGEPSRFWFNGDPVSGEGWLVDNGWLVDETASSDRASDKRILISAGPFDFAPGDTQQVVLALIAARGASRGAAVHMLRDRADYLRQRHMLNPHIAGFSTAALRTNVFPESGTEFRFTARTSGTPVTMEGEITDAQGRLIERVPLKEIVVGSDRVYSGTTDLPFAEIGANASFLASDGITTWHLPAEVSVPRAGTIVGKGAYLVQEGDDNGRIAPDEGARWVPRVGNETLFDLDVFIQHSTLPRSQWMHLPLLPAQGEAPSDEVPWETVNNTRSVPDPHEGWGTTVDSVSFIYDVFDVDRNSLWSLRNWVQTDSTAGEWYDLLMTQVRGRSNERPGIRIIDPTVLQDRWYIASFRIDSVIVDESFWRHYGDTILYPRRRTTRMIVLRDSLTGVPFFNNYGLDVFTGMAPTTDGFQVVRGTIGLSYSSYAIRDTAGINTATFGMRPGLTGQDVFDDADRADFRIVGDLSGTMVWNFADGGYEGLTRMPLHFFMRKDEGAWTRVHAAINEINPDIPDGQPNPDGGDYLLLYDIPYVANAEPEIKSLPSSGRDFPAQCALDLNAIPQSGEFNLIYFQPVTSEDLFIFNPRHVLLARSNKQPTTATMHPPAPMPFSDWTSVLMETQRDGAFRAEVYDMYGRRVKVLRDEFLEAGKHLLIWDGYWEDGRAAESGTYLLRAVAGGEEVSRKLMIVR